MCRVTIRPGFPGHVLFFGPCPGVWAGFQKCPGFVRVLNTSVPDLLKIRLLFVFSHVRPGLFDRHLLTYFSMFLLILFRELNTRASNISLNGKVTIVARCSLPLYGRSQYYLNFLKSGRMKVKLLFCRLVAVLFLCRLQSM